MNNRITPAQPTSPSIPTRRQTIVIAGGYETFLSSHHLDSLDALFAVVGGERLDKPGLEVWRERRRLTLDDAGVARVFYLKRFCDPPRSARRQVVRSGSGANSIAGMEWTWMNRLVREGIACVQPVAFGEEVRRSREIRSAILTAAVPGESLEKWAARWTAADRPRIQNLRSPSARLISQFHRAGYIHRDLYLSHIFYDPSVPSARSLHLIDLQRVIRPRWWKGRWVVKDLAALNFSTPMRLFSRTDRLRWLREYLAIAKLDGSARRLVYRIMGKTQSMTRHHQKRSPRLWNADGL